MNHRTVDSFLTREILTDIRDGRPTQEEFIARYGEQCFHLLRKAGAILLDGERLRLNSEHLTPDGQRFVWGVKLIHLDEDVIDLVRRGPERPQNHRELD